MYKIQSIEAEKIANIIDGKLYGKNSKVEYVSTDTRECFFLNTAYFALKGEKFNGNAFVNEAIKKGSSLIVSNMKLDTKISHIKVNDSTIALGALAKYLTQDIKKIGITGSVGKTTVKEMTHLVLSEKYNSSKTNNNENNEVGVPITLLKSANKEFCVVEMGMRGAGQIRYLSSLCEPEISIVTNVGTSHLEKLKSIENIFNAKMEILENTKKIVIVPYEKRFISYNYGKIKPIFVGKDVIVSEFEYNESGIKFSVDYFGEKITGFSINGFNLCNLNNAVFSIIVGKLYNVPNELIVSAIKKYRSENLHGEIIKIKGISVILDCYNASYESVKASLYSLKKFSEVERKTPYLLMGDMLEIGEKSEEFHYRIGELAKDLSIKNIFATGKYAKNILDGFVGGEMVENDETLSKKIFESLGENDVVLVKGSRKMNLEKIIE